MLVSRDAAAQLICEKKKLNFDNLKGTYELMILMHKFYRLEYFNFFTENWIRYYIERLIMLQDF